MKRIHEKTLHERKIDLFPIFLGIGELILLFILFYFFETSTAIFIADLSIFLVFICKYYRKYGREFKALKDNPRRIFTILGVAAGMIVFGLIFTKVFPQKSTTNLKDYSRALQLMLFLESVVFAPVLEEMIDRYSFGTLFRNKAVFVIVSAIVFAAFHANLDIYFLYYMVLGATLAITYLKSEKTITTTILIHSLFNLATFFLN